MTHLMHSSHRPYLEDSENKVIKFKDLNTNVTLQIWDTAGQERFRSIVSNYYKDAHWAIVVYDITSRESFDAAKAWIDDVKNKAPENVMIFLWGSKVDLENNRDVSFQSAHKLAKDNGWLFGETSAKTNTGVTETFEKIAKIYAEKGSKTEVIDPRRDTVSLEKQKFEKKKKSGCKC